MIRRLMGIVVGKTEQTLVLNVHDIGYLLYTPHTTEYQLDQTVTLHTYLAVRENALDLYGFGFEDELELFEQLLTLPKIGPKSALQILGQASLELIKTAVINNDPTQLSKMSGMGKKTAEKVVSGLTDIYEKYGLMVDMVNTHSGTNSHHLSDTIDALVALGYPEYDARKAVQQVSESRPDLAQTNDLLKVALQLLSQN